MTVKNINEAWNIVNAIFPTDYELDQQDTERAGYPVYRSTAESCNSWISDLGTRLEVNLDDGRTFNIRIDDTLNQTSKRLRKYFVYMEDGEHLFKTAFPAENEDDVRIRVAGNGDVISIKDITDCFPISVVGVTDALKEYGYGIHEINLITRTLTRAGICDC